MSRLGEWGRRFGMLLRRDQVANDLEDEMQLHLDLHRQQQVDAGVPSNDAGAASRRRFGNPTLLRERSYTAWGWNRLETLVQDILYGLRAMLRSPGITLVALLSLALGIGANTAIFSLMDAVMLRSLPVKNPQQLVLLGKGTASGITDDFGVTQLYSYPFYRELQKRNQVFSETASICSMRSDVHGTVSDRNQAEPMQVQLVSGTYFSTAWCASHPRPHSHRPGRQHTGRSSGRSRQLLVVEERPGARSQCAQSHAENRRHDLQHRRRGSS